MIGVGFDGGEESAGALRWAADQARRTGGRLHIIAVHEPAPFARVSAGAGALPTDSVSAAPRRELQQNVESAVADLNGDLAIDQTVLDGDPTFELATASSDLDLLVLGSRGYGPLGSYCSAAFPRPPWAPLRLRPWWFPAAPRADFRQAAAGTE